MRWAAGGAACAAAIVALLVGAPSGSEDEPPARAGAPHVTADTRDPAEATRVAAEGPTAPRTPVSLARPPAGGPPVGRVSIPAIGVSAEVVSLGLNPDRSLQVPARADRAGWWSGGAALGRSGPTVIVGHVDSRAGPGVFFSLRDLRRGDRIEVELDGRRRTFRVTRRTTHPKTAFPTRAVYGDTRGPALRLITCDGAFDGESYARNLVVYAS